MTKVLQLYYKSPSSNPSSYSNRRRDGGSVFRVRCASVRPNDSASILIPGPGPLMRRACKPEYASRLVNWFNGVQQSAWDAVNETMGDLPDSIFMVTGQTMTAQYAISHLSDLSGTSDIYLGLSTTTTNIDAPRWKATTASPIQGFRIQLDGRESLYSIFLEVTPSTPSQRINKPFSHWPKVSDQYIPHSLKYTE